MKRTCHVAGVLRVPIGVHRPGRTSSGVFRPRTLSDAKGRPDPGWTCRRVDPGGNTTRFGVGTTQRDNYLLNVRVPPPPSFPVRTGTPLYPIPCTLVQETRARRRGTLWSPWGYRTQQISGTVLRLEVVDLDGTLD